MPVIRAVRGAVAVASVLARPRNLFLLIRILMGWAAFEAALRVMPVDGEVLSPDPPAYYHPGDGKQFEVRLHARRRR